ncbi:hypothetical protein TNCV_2438481 [Trichonephila clavipes]|nr:hypothetical protein TNCV_2438481 [Trichonephila clavipes]
MLNGDPFLAVTAERGHRSTASDLSRQQSTATGTTSAEFVFRDDNIRHHRSNIVSECVQSNDNISMKCVMFLSMEKTSLEVSA